jgi:hypothetical protein
MKDHNSGAKDQAEEGGVGGTGANVVHFPRNWYGSVDELVPIDPGPPPGSDRPGSLTDASAFWGGGDGGGDGRPEGVEARRSEAAAADLPTAGEDDPRVGSVGPVPPRLKPKVHRRRRRRGLPATAVALALVALGAVAAIGTLSERGAPNQVGRSTPARKPVLTVTQTIPQTTTVVQTVSTAGSALAGQRSTKWDSNRTTDPSFRKQKVGSATSHVQSPAQSVASTAPPPPSSSSASGDVTRPAGSGSTSSTAGSSKPSCAPSVTNGGGCSL